MRIPILGLFLVLVLAPAALAQTGKRVAVGAALGFTRYSDSDFSSKNPGVSLAYRLRLNATPNDGWSWALKSGLGWSNRKTSADIGGIPTQLGKLQTVLLMGGVQRVFHCAPYQFGMGVVAGASINHFKVDAAARDAYESRLGSDLSGITVKNSLAVRPDVSATYDLNSRFAVQGSISYLFNRPKAETTLDGVTTTSTWKTDHASASVGLLIGLF